MIERVGPVELVAGARPNFMKVAPILRELERRGIAARLVHTGQHYDQSMSEVFLRDLGIREPDVRLGVGSGTHAVQTARIMEGFEAHLAGADPRPACVTVVGDVNSTMACTLVAAKMQVPVCHVEAGLRSFDRGMPEEVNRIVTDALADLLLVSEPEGTANLRREGVTDEKVRYVGNVMIDTLVEELERARALGVHEALGLPARKYAYVTLHRPSNVDDLARLRRIVRFLVDTARLLPVVFPVHPRTRERLRAAGAWSRLEKAPELYLLDPLGYRESLCVMQAARVVLTDSGGIQEETSFLEIPCLTLRSNTERPSTVTLGTNTLVGDDLDEAGRLVREVLADRYPHGRPIPGWDGRAAARVVDALCERYLLRPRPRPYARPQAY